jgi:hypothetical protein
LSITKGGEYSAKRNFEKQYNDSTTFFRIAFVSNANSQQSVTHENFPHRIGCPFLSCLPAGWVTFPDRGRGQAKESKESLQIIFE